MMSWVSWFVEPSMLTKAFIAVGLVVGTVAIHAVGFDALLRVIVRSRALALSGFHRVAPLVIGVTCWLIVIHLLEISAWGLFYFWRGCLPDAESALYFSGVTYTTVGYGDLVLPREWRMLAPLEALTGILMYGLSTGMFFALVSKWIKNWMLTNAVPEPHSAAPLAVQRTDH
jgi:ion channel